MKVTEYMTKEADAQVASPSTSLEDIAKQLIKHNCSCIVIVEDKKPVGTLTKTDITRAFAEGISPGMHAESFIGGDLICAKEDTQTDDIADLIQRERIHHVVVVDGEGNFKGVVSSWDVAREVSLDAKAFPYNRELWTKAAVAPAMQ